MGGDLPPLSHSRIETLDGAGLPRVILVGADGLPFQPWQRYAEEHRLGIGSQRSYSRSLGLFLAFSQKGSGIGCFRPSPMHWSGAPFGKERILRVSGGFHVRPSPRGARSPK
jgi:hypothetical protein